MWYLVLSRDLAREDAKQSHRDAHAAWLDGQARPGDGCWANPAGPSRARGGRVGHLARGATSGKLEDLPCLGKTARTGLAPGPRRRRRWKAWRWGTRRCG